MIETNVAESMKLIDSVWRKGTAVWGHDNRRFRKDCEGNLMQREEYGSRTSEFGWEIDHIVPAQIGGGSNIENLRPLHWRTKAKHKQA